MQQFSLCFGRVKKDCLKFIKSQETKADKFKNKERMIKSFLIPLCFWISEKADKKKPYFVGLAGGQGTGKTTISSLIRIILTKYFKLNVKFTPVSNCLESSLLLANIVNFKAFKKELGSIFKDVPLSTNGKLG